MFAFDARAFVGVPQSFACSRELFACAVRIFVRASRGMGSLDASYVRATSRFDYAMRPNAAVCDCLCRPAQVITAPVTMIRDLGGP